MKTEDLAKAVVENPAFQPRPDGTTFCNFALQLMGEAAFGCPDFRGKNANAIHDLMVGSSSWERLDGAASAQEASNKGRLVVASQKAEGHGHVAVVIPGACIQSGQWKGPAPRIANVGKSNGLMGANFAFSKPCEFFAWKGAGRKA